MKTFGEKIKGARKARQMTQKELAARIGAAHNSISDWENNKNKPDPDTIELLCGALDISPNYLLEAKSDAFSPLEKSLVDMYRALDQRGRDVVDYILEEEYFRCQQMEEAVNYNDSMVPMLFAGYRAAAGRWVYDENMEVETILVKRKEGADFVMGVSGDSMEPDYNDGDMVYVKRTSQLEFGDVGLFQIGDEYYIKELGPDGLHSRNPKWSVIPKSEDIIVVGKVLGKVEKEKPWRPEKKK